MKNYVVRVYRQKRGNPYGLVGIVEEAGKDGKRAFTNFDELWDILDNRPSKRPGETRDKKKQSDKEKK